MTDTPQRCAWCGTDPLYVDYHDTEWGVPEYDSRALWEKLVLDGFQAGLSWITILRKRDDFRECFEGFDPERVARWGEADILRALQNPGIVRHRGKIEAAVTGARAYLEIEAAEGFSPFIWSFVGGRPIQNALTSMAGISGYRAVVEAANAGTDILPAVWPVRGFRADVLPESFAARIGLFSFDAGSPVMAGTWAAARHVTRPPQQKPTMPTLHGAWAKAHWALACTCCKMASGMASAWALYRRPWATSASL